MPSLFCSHQTRTCRRSEEEEQREGGEAMQQQHWRFEPVGLGEDPAPTTVDEASMERSKSFVKALQELKNLRPQLYPTYEYSEKS